MKLTRKQKQVIKQLQDFCTSKNLILEVSRQGLTITSTNMRPIDIYSARIGMTQRDQFIDDPPYINIEDPSIIPFKTFIVEKARIKSV